MAGEKNHRLHRMRLRPLAMIAAGMLVSTGSVPAVADGLSQGPAGRVTLPSFRITGGVPPDVVERLTANLGIDAKPEPSGGLSYLGSRFGNLPMKPASSDADLPSDEDGNKTTGRAFDLASIRRIEPVPPERAARRIDDAVDAAGLEPHKLLAGGSALPIVRHAQFTFETRGMNRPVTVEIDTQVDYELKLNGGSRTVPFLGPGASMSFTLDRRGAATEARLLLPALERGPDVEIVDAEEAEDECASRYAADGFTTAEVRTRLVYHAPTADYSTQDQLLPSFECSGEERIAGRTVRLERFFVPATVNPPTVAVTAHLQDGRVIADATPDLGTPPYSIRWTSSSGSIPAGMAASAGHHVEYEILVREDAASTREDVCATVTDANGSKGVGCAELKLPSPPGRAFPASPYDGVDVGTETSRLYDHADTDSFARAAELAGIAVEFNWRGTSAWERDFKARGIGRGQDTVVADAVDLVYFAGTGGPGSIFMREPDDWSLFPSVEARWGDNDVEWVAMSTCGLLHRSAADEVASAFWGAHMILGYTNPVYATDDGGEVFVRGLTAPVMVRQAWADMTATVQPTDPRRGPAWALLGPIGPRGMTNYDDYFWGRERDVTPDIPRDKVRGWYHLQSAG